MYAAITSAQPITSGAFVKADRFPNSQATTRPAADSHASTRAAAARPQATPAQKPRLGVNQIPNNSSAIAIGSTMPASSLNTLAGESAANVAPATATCIPQ